jgi:hypothetical protein
MVGWSAFLATAMAVALAAPSSAFADQKKTSPKLYQSAAKGDHLRSVTIERTAPTGGSTGPTEPSLPTTSTLAKPRTPDGTLGGGVKARR